MGKHSKFLIDVEDGRKKCSICYHEFNKQKHSNTNVYNYHLRTKHKKEFNMLNGIVDDSQVQDDEPASKKPPLVQPTIAQSFAQIYSDEKNTKIRRALMQLIACAALPISFVDHPAWKNFCSTAIPKFHTKSQKHYQREELDGLYNEYKQKLMKDLEKVPFAAISFDGWSDSSNKHQYLGVICHFVENNSLSYRLLGAVDITQERHTGEYLKRKIESLLEEFDISEKVTASIRDGAPNVSVAAELLNYPHFDCLAHKLNLAVGAGIACFQNLQNTLDKFRKISNRLNKSSNDRREYLEVSERLGMPPLALKKHIPVRWNTVHAVFERALKVKDTIDYLCIENWEWPKITNNDWNTAKTVVEILQPIVDGTVLIQNRGMSCSAIIPLCKVLIRDLKANTKFQQFCDVIVEKLKKELEKYEKIEFLQIAMMLDIRFMLDYADEEYKNRLLDIMLSFSNSSNDTDVEECAEVQVKPDNPFTRFMNARNNAQNSQNARKKPKPNSKEEAVQNEHKCWFDRESDMFADPFEFWCRSSSKETFPILQKLFFKYFSAPATTAEAERLFSVAKTVLTDNRKLLSAENFSKLIFIQQNVRNMGYEYQAF